MVAGRSPHPVSCERALELASLRLDGELSELERAALGQHLDACARCATAATEIETVTAVVRAAPLERPSRRFELPRRPVSPLARVAAVAAVPPLGLRLSGLGAAGRGGP